MRVPTCIEPSETWEVDLCEADLRHAVDLWKSIIDGRRVAARDARAALEGMAADAPGRGPAETKAEWAEREIADAEKALAETEAELAAYVPGSGPVFVVGHIPGPKRAEIAGMHEEEDAAAKGRDKVALAHAWRREVIRWAVRGHRNLKNAKGEDVPFDGEKRTVGSETFVGPTEKQIERYLPFLSALANVAMFPQQLGGAEKNGSGS